VARITGCVIPPRALPGRLAPSSCGSTHSVAPPRGQHDQETSPAGRCDGAAGVARCKCCPAGLGPGGSARRRSS
jgi:hypothetical protein